MRGPAPLRSALCLCGSVALEPIIEEGIDPRRPRGRISRDRGGESTGDPGPTDQALLSRIAARDQTALAALYDRYASVSLALARRIVGDPAEAEDVLQNALLRIWQQAERYDAGRGSPTAWLLALVRNASIDRLRRRDAHERAAQGAAAVPDRGSSVELREDQERVAQAVDLLPADQREAIELAYFEGLSQTEIAGRLGQPLGTVKTRMRLGMMKLRQALLAVTEESR